ncbi:MAG: hypothetical protein CMJ78_14010 [Planctomycetaceae bacterium]|nr:hypothetical protein [Planctomycetaceae bacterium]
MMHCRSLLLACLVTALSTTSFAATKVHVVTGKDAPQIEQFAATELVGQLNRLFQDVEAVRAEGAGNAKHVILVGSAATNEAVGKAFHGKWPKVSDQGIVIQSTERGLIIGGGSPAATLWGVYEFGYRNGIRYLFRSDIYPDQQPLKLSGYKLRIEPALKNRTWRTVNDFPIGPESWGLEEHKRFLGQLAKMKFNGLMLSVYPWQPFVDYEFAGVKKSTATLWYGEEYRVDGDTAGKKVFRGKKVFENPDFAEAKDYKAKTAAGTKLLTGIIDEAHRLGMSVGLSISPLQFPREFERALPGSKIERALNQLTIIPSTQKSTDETLKALVATKIAAYIKTYPTINELYLGMPEFPEWHADAEAAWEELTANKDVDGLTLAKLIETGRQRNLIASGKRGVESVRGNVVTLAFLNNLLNDDKLLTRPDGKKVVPVLRQIDPVFYPILDKVIPTGAATMNFIDYTARRVAEHPELLASLPADKVDARLILTLADDNIGILPQTNTQSIGKLMALLHKNGWSGFSTRYWTPAELDSSVHFIARSAWDAKVTPRSAHDSLWRQITSNDSASDRLWIGQDNLEKATALIDLNDIGFAFPVKGMLMKQYRPEAPPKWWETATEHYTQSMIELYRAGGAIHPRSRKLVFYYSKRGEFPLSYFAAVTALREAALAKKDGDTEKAIEQMEAAIEAIYNGITTYADVSEDQSDRGVVAVLNKFGYHPLLAEYEKLLEEE